MIDDLSSGQVKEILSFYDCGNLTKMEKIKQGFANKNYLVSTDQGKILLRLYKQQGIREIEWELSILAALEKEKFPTAYPVKRKDSLLKTIFENEVIVLFPFLEGTEPDVNKYTAGAMAEVIARLNLFPDWSKFPKKNAVHVDNATSLIEEFPRAVIQLPVIFSFFEKEITFLEPYLRQNLPIGLVHGDAFPDNTLFTGNKLIGLIDFEEGAIDTLMYDVGITINGFCIKNNRLDMDLLEVFLKQYELFRPLNGEEKDVLFAFIHWGAAAMIYWHLRNNLLYQRNKMQINRIMELIDRIKDYQKREAEILRFIENYRTRTE